MVRHEAPGRVKLLLALTVLVFSAGSCSEPQETVQSPENDGPSPKAASSHNQTSTQQARTQRTLCVIDDSADMLGDYGVYADKVTGEVPLFAYLLPQLQCSACLPWSKFDVTSLDSTVGTSCAGFALRRQDLTMTSPLSSAVRSLLGRDTVTSDVVFVTNGLDWQTRGGDAQFRVELDVGADACDWLRREGRSLMLATAADRSGGISRRPLAILGFTRAEPAALHSGANVPGVFFLHSFAATNPATWLRDGSVAVRPSFAINTRDGIATNGVFGPGGEAAVQIATGGDAIAHVSVRVDSRVRSDVSIAWHVSVDGADYRRVESRRTADGSYDLTVPLGDVPLGGRSYRIQLSATIALPEEMERVLPLTHSIRRTVTSLASQCRVNAPIRVDRRGGVSVDALTLVVSGGFK